jgi:hypothetical protein
MVFFGSHTRVTSKCFFLLHFEAGLLKLKTLILNAFRENVFSARRVYFFLPSDPHEQTDRIMFDVSRAEAKINAYFPLIKHF